MSSPSLRSVTKAEPRPARGALSALPRCDSEAQASPGGSSHRSMTDERPAVAGLSGFGRCGCSGLRVCDEPFAVSPHRPMLVLLAALERHPDGGVSRIVLVGLSLDELTVVLVAASEIQVDAVNAERRFAVKALSLGSGNRGVGGPPVPAVPHRGGERGDLAVHDLAVD